MKLSGLLVLGMIFSISACNGGNASVGGTEAAANAAATGQGSSVTHPSPSTTPSKTATPRTYKTDVLLFAGTGAWQDEVGSLKSIMDEHGLTYQAVTSSELDGMSLDEIADFGMIIWPGGYAGTAGSSLSDQTHENLRAAIQEKGVNYLGFCAGAFIAVAPKDSKSSFLGIIDAPELEYYYLEDQGVEAQMTMATFADGTQRDLLWYGGPVTQNVPGGVIAKYPNGNPMMTEQWSGNGFVILSADHPAALQNIRDSYGLKDSDGLDFDIAYKLIDAALHQKPLPAFKE